MPRTLTSSLLGALLLLPTLTWSQNSPPGLFYAPTPKELPAHVQLPAQALAGHYAKINLDLLRLDRLTLQLPEGRTVQIGRRHKTSHPNGTQVWRGLLLDDLDSSVILAQHGKAIAGVIRSGDDLYKIQYVGKGVHAVVKVSPEEPMPEHDPLSGDNLSSGTSTPTASDFGSDDGSQIDVMVVYSTASKERYGGTDGINSLITVAIEETNTAYAKSDINTRLRLVHTTEVQNSSGVMRDDLYQITDSSDGILDEVHQWRDTYGADMVSWFNEAPTYCGIAWLNNSLSQANAFSVVASDCATGYYSTGHELGHNMGSAHDKDNAGNDGIYLYSFGYQEPNNAFRTVMAYNCGNGGCVRKDHFSNPQVLLEGKPTGTSSADNARSINLTRVAASQWRTALVGVPPSAVFSYNCDLLNCSFTDQSSSSGALTSWAWNFGGDGTSSEQNPSHTFSAAGDYVVTLTIMDDSGASGIDTQTITVDDGSAQPPVEPGAPSAVDNGNGSATVSWTDNSSNETAFQLERQTQHPKNRKWTGSTLLSASAESTSVDDTTGNGTFRYRVRAYNDYGSSAWSNWATVTVTGGTSSGGGNKGGGKGGGKKK